MKDMNRVAIVTGGTKGIGGGICRRLLSGGVNVATLYHRDQEAADRLKSFAQAVGMRAIVECIDVRDSDALKTFVASAQNEFGRIDYFINNVGIDVFKSIMDLSFHEWKESQDIILNAPLVLCRLVVPIMRHQAFGRIINIGASSKDYMKGTPGARSFWCSQGRSRHIDEDVGNRGDSKRHNRQHGRPWQHPECGDIPGRGAYPDSFYSSRSQG